jgi:hypothetical protein
MVDEVLMCRNIKTLYNFEPPASQDEIRASSLQFVRKLSGFARPSQAERAGLQPGVDQVTEVVHELLATLVTNAPPATARSRRPERRRGRRSGLPPRAEGVWVSGFSVELNRPIVPERGNSAAAISSSE